MDIIINDIDFVINKNIFKLFNNLGINIESEQLDIERFLSEKKKISHFIYDGKKENINYKIIQITEGSDYTKKDILINLIHSYSQYFIYIIKHSNKKINVNFNNIKIIDGDKLLLYNWIKFGNKKNYVYRLIPEDELRIKLTNYFIDERSIGNISCDSHECIWNGFIPGDYIEILYPTLASSGRSGTIKKVI